MRTGLALLLLALAWPSPVAATCVPFGGLWFCDTAPPGVSTPAATIYYQCRIYP